MNKDLRTAYVLADLTRQIDYDVLPEQVLAKARELIFDSMGCMIGGVNMVQGQKIINVFESMKGIEDVSIYGTNKKIPLLNAVYVNSYLATVLDLDDTYDGHPGSTIVPVALSMAEQYGVSAKKLVEAVVAGYEIGIRVANGIKPTPERTKQVRGINTWQIFCATAVAAKILDLDREQTAHAYGHAAIHASVPSLRKWGFIDGKIHWLKNNFGYTSYGGVLSAILAQNDFIADTTIFDGEDGFWIMASSDKCDYDQMQMPLDMFNILKVHTKPYCACRHIHPTLDGLTQIAQQTSLDPLDIASIDIATFYEVAEDYTSMPSLPFDIVFSAPYLAALVMNRIPPGPEWFRPEYLKDDKILKTAGKVQIGQWDEANKLYPLVNRELMSNVKVVEKNGTIHTKTIRIPKGDPRNPMTPSELFSKFNTIVSPVLGPEKCSTIQDVFNGCFNEPYDLKLLLQHISVS